MAVLQLLMLSLHQISTEENLGAKKKLITIENSNLSCVFRS